MFIFVHASCLYWKTLHVDHPFLYTCILTVDGWNQPIIFVVCKWLCFVRRGSFICNVNKTIIFHSFRRSSKQNLTIMGKINISFTNLPGLEYPTKDCHAPSVLCTNVRLLHFTYNPLYMICIAQTYPRMWIGVKADIILLDLYPHRNIT